MVKMRTGILASRYIGELVIKKSAVNTQLMVIDYHLNVARDQ